MTRDAVQTKIRGEKRDVTRGKKEKGKMFYSRRQRLRWERQWNAHDASSCVRFWDQIVATAHWQPTDLLIREQVPILSKWTVPQLCLWAKQKHVTLPALLPSYLDTWLYCGILRHGPRCSRLMNRGWGGLCLARSSSASHAGEWIIVSFHIYPTRQQNIPRSLLLWEQERSVHLADQSRRERSKGNFIILLTMKTLPWLIKISHWKLCLRSAAYYLQAVHDSLSVHETMVPAGSDSEGKSALNFSGPI